MGTNSNIAWTHHTFNPWRGCTKVSDGCKFCYAEKLSGRNPKALGVWGPNGTRAIAAESYWKLPERWNKWASEGICYACGGAGVSHVNKIRSNHNGVSVVGLVTELCTACNGKGKFDAPYVARVFCASLADIAESPETMPAESVPLVEAARKRMVETFEPLTNLVLMLLTKRPWNLPNCFPASFLKKHWVGTSIENQNVVSSRASQIIECPGAIRFLSCEPLIGAIDLGDWLDNETYGADGGDGPCPRIDLVIAGDESGAHRRRGDHAWHRWLLSQCRATGVAFFEKQLHIDGRLTADIEEFPEDLRVREMPEALPPSPSSPLPPSSNEPSKGDSQ